MRRVCSGLALLAAGLVLQGCGTVFGLGLDQDVRVITRPEGADLALNDIPLEGLTTPCTVSADTAVDQRISARLIDKNGRELKGRTTFTREVRSWVIVLDAVCTLGLGLLVDWATGAMYRFDREHVVINLGKIEFAPPQPPPIRIAQPQIPRPRGAAGASDPAPAPVRKKRGPGLCDVCGEPRGDGPFCPHCGYR